MIVVIGFLGCKEQVSEIQSKLSNSIILEGKIISQDGSLFKEPLQMVQHGNYLIYYTAGEKTLFKVFDCILGKVIAEYIEAGVGPGELMMIGSMQGPDSLGGIHIYDVVKKSVYELYICKSNPIHYNLNMHTQIEDGGMQAFVLDTAGLIVMNGPFSDSRFRLLRNGKVISKYKKFPSFDVSIKDTAHLNTGFFNLSAVNIFDHKMANIVYTSEIIEAFEITNNQILPIWSHEWSFKPITERTVGNGTMVVQSNDSFGFKSITVNKSNIFCIYSNLTYAENRNLEAHGKYLVIFNWEGGLEEVFELDHFLRTISVSEDGKKLYGTSIIDTDIKIIEYTF